MSFKISWRMGGGGGGPPPTTAAAIPTPAAPQPAAVLSLPPSQPQSLPPPPIQGPLMAPNRNPSDRYPDPFRESVVISTPSVSNRVLAHNTTIIGGHRLDFDGGGVAESPAVVISSQSDAGCFVASQHVIPATPQHAATTATTASASHQSRAQTGGNAVYSGALLASNEGEDDAVAVASHTDDGGVRRCSSNDAGTEGGALLPPVDASPILAVTSHPATPCLAAAAMASVGPGVQYNHNHTDADGDSDHHRGLRTPPPIHAASSTNTVASALPVGGDGACERAGPPPLMARRPTSRVEEHQRYTTITGSRSEGLADRLAAVEEYNDDDDEAPSAGYGLDEVVADGVPSQHDDAVSSGADTYRGAIPVAEAGDVDGDSDGEEGLPEAPAYVERRPVDPQLVTLRRNMLMMQSQQRGPSAASIAPPLPSFPLPPPPIRLCSLVVHKGALGYAWLDRSHVLVCGQTVQSSLWVTGGGNRWQSSNSSSSNNTSGGGHGKGASASASSPAYALPFFGLKRAKAPRPSNNATATSETTTDTVGGALDRTMATDGPAAAEEREGGESAEGGGGRAAAPLFRRDAIPKHLTTGTDGSSINRALPKSIAADTHDASLLDAAASILVQVGMDSLPSALMGGGGGSDGGDDSPQQSPRGAGSAAHSSPALTFGVSPTLPCIVRIVFPTGADGNTTDFIGAAIRAAEASLRHTIGSQLAQLKAAEEAEQEAKKRKQAHHQNRHDKDQRRDGGSDQHHHQNMMMMMDVAIASYMPLFEVHYTPRLAFNAASAKAGLVHLWPDIPLAGWSCKLDLSQEAMVLGMAGALHHVIGCAAAVAAATTKRVGNGLLNSSSIHNTTADIGSRVNAIAAGLRRHEGDDGVSLSPEHGPPVQNGSDEASSSFLVADIAHHPGSGHFLHVDAGTFDSLHVFRVDSHPSAIYNIGASKEGLSLYFLMARKAVSPLGKELLRQWLAMPTCDEATLAQRLDQVAFFVHVIANGGLQVPTTGDGGGGGGAFPTVGAVAGGPARAPTVDLVAHLNKLLRRVQHPDYIVNRLRLQRHSAGDYRSLLFATTALLDVCKLLAPFAEICPCVKMLLSKCHPEAARRLIERISTTIDLEQCDAADGNHNKRGGARRGGGGDGGDGSASGGGMARNTVRASGGDAPILRGVSQQLDQLRDCYNSIDFDAFLAAAARKALEQLPPYLAAQWKVSVAFMPHMGYLAVVDLSQVRARPLPSADGGDDEDGGVSAAAMRMLSEGDDAAGTAEQQPQQRPPPLDGRSGGSHALNLPEGWEFVFQNTTQCFCRTALTRELDTNIGDLHVATKEVSAAILQALDEDVLSLAHCLSAVRHVAEIDACLALAKLSVEEGWTRPVLVNEAGCASGGGGYDDDATTVYCANGIVISGGFHPLLSRATPHPVIPFNLNLTHHYQRQAQQPQEGISEGGGADHDGASTVAGADEFDDDAASWYGPQSLAGGGGASPAASIRSRRRRNQRRAGIAADDASNNAAPSSASPSSVPIKSLSDDRRVVVLTGPHGSGKSICQRAVGIIALLAHVGSFVPASYASVPLFMDRIVCIDASTPTTLSMLEGSAGVGGGRGGGGANQLRNGGMIGGASHHHHYQQQQASPQPRLAAHALCSSFGRELAAMCRALHSVTNNSLVIVDEFGKGTLAADGVAILAAVLQTLADETPQRQLGPLHVSSALGRLSPPPTLPPIPTPPMCVFTTHYTEVFEEALISPRCIAWKHMMVLVMAEEEEGEAGGQHGRGGGGRSPTAATSHHQSHQSHYRSTVYGDDPSPSRSMLPSVYNHNNASSHHHQQLLLPQSPADTGYGGGGFGPSPIPHRHQQPSALSPPSSLSPIGGASSPFGNFSAAISRISDMVGGPSSASSYSPFGGQQQRPQPPCFDNLSRSARSGGRGRGGGGAKGRGGGAAHRNGSHHQLTGASVLRGGGGQFHTANLSPSPFTFNNNTNSNHQPFHQHHGTVRSNRAQQLADAVYASTGRRLVSPSNIRYLSPQHANDDDGDGRSVVSGQQHGPSSASPYYEPLQHPALAYSAGGGGFRHMDPTLASPLQQQGGLSPGAHSIGALSAISGAHRHVHGGAGGAGAGISLESRVVYLYELEPCTLDKMFRSALETARVAGVPQVILGRAAQLLESFRTTELLTGVMDGDGDGRHEGGGSGYAEAAFEEGSEQDGAQQMPGPG